MRFPEFKNAGDGEMFAWVTVNKLDILFLQRANADGVEAGRKSSNSSKIDFLNKYRVQNLRHYKDAFFIIRARGPVSHTVADDLVCRALTRIFLVVDSAKNVN